MIFGFAMSVAVPKKSCLDGYSPTSFGLTKQPIKLAMARRRVCCCIVFSWWKYMVFVASKCSHGSKIPLGFVHVIVFRNYEYKNGFVTILFYRDSWATQTLHRSEYFISSRFLNIAVQWMPYQWSLEVFFIYSYSGIQSVEHVLNLLTFPFVFCFC